MKLLVLKEFRDKEDHSTHKVGDTLCITDLARINKMVQVGACEIVSIEDDPEPADAYKVAFNGKEYDVEAVKAALEEIGAPVAKNAKLRGVTGALEKITAEQAEALSAKLDVKEGE